MNKNFITGFICGGIICAAATGFAVEYAVTANPYPVKVNGVETTIQGYNINDETYFKLRDVSAAVGGFEVGFEDNAIIVNTPQKPTPSMSPSAASASNLAIGKAIDGIETKCTDGQWYVYEDSIKNKYKGKYDFGTGDNGSEFVGKIVDGKLYPIIENIPQGKEKFTVDLDWYNTVLQPWLASEGWKQE